MSSICAVVAFQMHRHEPHRHESHHRESNRYSSVTDESGISDLRCSTPVSGDDASRPPSRWSSDCDRSKALFNADFVTLSSKMLNKLSTRQSDQETSGEKPQKRSSSYYCETLEVMHVDAGERHKLINDGSEDVSPEGRGIPIMSSATESRTVIPFAGRPTDLHVLSSCVVG